MHYEWFFDSTYPRPRTTAYQTVVSAFTDDPVERWLYHELPEYLTHFLSSWRRSAVGHSTNRPCGVLANALLLPSGYPRAQSQTAMPSVLCSQRPFRRISTGTPSLSSNKWTLFIPRTRIGISRGLALTRTYKVEVSAAS